MKKIVSLTLSLVLILLSLCSCVANTQGLEAVVIENNECVVSIGQAVYLSKIKIPARIDGNKVVAIDKEGFIFAEKLQKIVIPRGVTYIGDRAFYGCQELEVVKLSNVGVTYIGANAFQGCKSLKSFVIPEGVERIESETFFGCLSLTSLTIPSTVTYIGDRAFRRCTSLTELYIPAGVTHLGKSVFVDCDSLEKITFGGSYDEWRALIRLTGSSTVDNGLFDVDIVYEK